MPEKMNPEAKREWLSDLRSGKFSQGREALRGDVGHCCLGVLCETYKRVTGMGEWVDGHTFDSGQTIDLGHGEMVDRDFATLPKAVTDWAGLTSHGDIPGDPIRYEQDGDIQYADALVELNDDAEWDFNRIANVIEERF